MTTDKKLDKKIKKEKIVNLLDMKLTKEGKNIVIGTIIGIILGIIYAILTEDYILAIAIVWGMTGGIVGLSLPIFVGVYLEIKDLLIENDNEDDKKTRLY